ncbi:hypothetical protein [Pseudomonas sp. RL]|uniref:hypothetical protein n=1 Tax=Pseudomonas sp. RL TaxID=1452718 RepID=UPI0004866F91|nr:hypothetical protein [Pseudomonas sp. RL]
MAGGGGGRVGGGRVTVKGVATQASASDTPLADEMARISRAEFERYLADYRPLEEATISSLDESSEAAAMGRAVTDQARARSALERMRGRYGTEVNPATMAAEARQNSLSGALNTLTAGNTAQLADLDNQRQTLSGLLNVGQSLRQESMGNYSAASGLEGARHSANQANAAAAKQQRASNRNAMIQAGVSLGAAALFAF